MRSTPRPVTVMRASRAIAGCLVLLLLAGCSDHRRARLAAARRAPAPQPAHSPACGKGQFLVSESFISARVGYVVRVPGDDRCPAQLLRTVNGGVSFTLRDRLPGDAVVFTSPQVGWSYPGGLDHTTDGGRSWHAVPGTGDVSALAARGPDVLAVLSHCGPDRCRHTLLSSSDGGARWSRRALAGTTTSAQWDQAQVLLPGGRQGYVLVGSKLLRVLIAPLRLLAAVDPGDCQDPQGSFVGPWLSGTGAGDLWLLCALEPGAGNQGKLLFHSRDGGRRWHQLPGHDEFFQLHTPVPDGGYVDGFSAADATHLFISLDRGTLIESADGGRRWRAAALGPSPDADLGDTGPDGVDFIDARHGWTITLDGAVYRTSDGGRRWRVTNLG